MAQNDMSMEEVRGYSSESLEKIRNNCTIQIARLHTLLEETKEDIGRLQLIRARCTNVLRGRQARA